MLLRTVNVQGWVRPKRKPKYIGYSKDVRTTSVNNNTLKWE